MDLKDFTLEELYDEVEIRELAEKAKNKPKPLKKPDLKDLKHVIAEYINGIYNRTYNKDYDDIQYIFEVAVKAIYGNEIFDWINKNI